MLVAAGCDPRLVPVPSCAPLEGSTQLADIDAAGVPIVCQDRTPDMPSTLLGSFDGTTIRIFPLTPGFSADQELQVAEHEFGHAMNFRHSPAWDDQWSTLRGIPAGFDAEEDFAQSWAYCVYPRLVGVNYAPFPAGTSPHETQCAVMVGFYNAR